MEVATDLNSMVVNVVELLHVAVKVKLAVAGMDRGRIDLSGLGVFRPPVSGSLDLHLGGSGGFRHTCEYKTKWIGLKSTLLVKLYSKCVLCC